MRSRFWKACTAALFALAFVPGHASAQGQAECTETAEQAGYNMKLRVLNGKVSDGNKVYRLGRSLIKLCKGRYNAQGLGAELLARLLPSLQVPEQQKAVLALAFEGASRNDLDYSDVKTIVKNPDGSDKTLYSYASVSSVLKKEMAVTFLNLAAQGIDMSDLIGTEMTSCPYAQDEQMRAYDEAKALLGFVSKGHPAAFEPTANRIKELKRVCEYRASDLTYVLGALYSRRALNQRGDVVNRYTISKNVGIVHSLDLAALKEAEANARTALPYVQKVLDLPDDTHDIGYEDIDDIKDYVYQYKRDLNDFIKDYAAGMKCRETRGFLTQSFDPCPDPY